MMDVKRRRYSPEEGMKAKRTGTMEMRGMGGEERGEERREEERE